MTTTHIYIVTILISTYHLPLDIISTTSILSLIPYYFLLLHLSSYFISHLFFFLILLLTSIFFFFFLNDPAPTEIYPLPLPAALPISSAAPVQPPAPLLRRHLRVFPPSGPPHDPPRTSASADTTSGVASVPHNCGPRNGGSPTRDRKSTRLNSSHLVISYAVFCLKKKK